MFILTVMVIKMLNMAHFLYFLRMTAKGLVTVCTKYLSSPISSLFWEYGMVYRLWSYHSWDIKGRYIKNNNDNNNNKLLQVNILLMIAEKPIIHNISERAR